ncbi:MAG: hypothetical protein KGL93_05920 [Gemmatimonadota bacterium]|nr:hypothetical protein [Gemmatimonadota bacterium]HEU4990099.1 hypothetical protein [Gemmatimonadaceae bacterium]
MMPAMLLQQVIIPPGIPDNAIPIIGIVFGTMMIMVLGLPIIRAIIRAVERRTSPPPAPALPPDIAARLDRIEQSVDSIAVEIERVAEAQRFLTKLQTEARALPGSPAQPPR